MAIAVKLDDLLYERRMTLTDLADRIGDHAGQPVDPQDRKGARDPLLDARRNLRGARVSAWRHPAVRAGAGGEAAGVRRGKRSASR